MSITQRSSEEAVGGAKLERYAHAEAPRAPNQVKPYVGNVDGEIVVLSSDEEEIDSDTGKPYQIPPSLMSPFMNKGFVNLPTRRESNQVKKEAAKKSLKTVG